MRTENLLREVIEKDLEELNDDYLKPEERSVVVDRVTRLIDRLIELEKINVDCEEKFECRKLDKEYKLHQFKADKKDRSIKNWISGAAIILPLGLYAWGIKASFVFEENGTISSMMGRSLMTKLIPKMKI